MSVPDQNEGANKKTVFLLTLLTLAMLGLGMSAKPLYNTFCRVTGYGGTTRVADNQSQTIIDRDIRIRFDTNVSDALPWEFYPLDTSVNVKLGQNVLVFFGAKNLSDHPIVGTASYSVSPVKAAPFFDKVECFCFTEQLLEPGELVKMPVLFFVDPDLANDERLDDIKTITLSYTFHVAKNPSEDVMITADRVERLKEVQELKKEQELELMQ
ncbi:MAG: cytochrome c oxidase assembly protein [Robiginitomaculum sp.]